MNFDGKFDAKLHVNGSGTHPVAHHHVDSVVAHAPSDAIIVPDADLLFNGDFKRSGVDLIVSRDDHELVVPDYFKGEKRAALASPDGAHLTGDIVNALAGHVEYAQADGSAGAGKVIGHVTKLVGTATAIRNGVSIILNQGDNVEKGDVVQSGSGSTLGITFIDGTVFGLSANARMVLNEMVYDPNGSNNSALISLVAGTISFVAGQTAKHGDMKIDTPVATMGIRGTAVLVEIDFDVPGQNGTPEAKFQVLVEPDGTTGSYILFDKNTLAPMAIVDKAGQQVHISNNNVSFSDSPLSPELQKLITDVFTLKFSNANPQSFTHFTDTLTPQQTGSLVQLADAGPPAIVHVTITPIISAIGTPSFGPAGGLPIPHINQAPVVTTGDTSLTERAGVTGSDAIDTISGTISFADINLGDRPTAKASFSSFTYQNADHQNIAASAQELADIQALENIPLVVVQSPGNTANGTATWTLNVPDKAFDFLGAGDTLTLTYMAEVDSNFAGGNLATFVPITITITGTNDAPVITSGPETVAFVNVGTDTTGPNLHPKPVAPTTNKLTFKDPDLTDTHTVSTDLTNATLSGKGVPTLGMQALETKFPRPMDVFESALSAAVTTDSTGTGTGTITWTLADISSFYADIVPAGETLTLTYTVTVKDSQGETSSQKVIVTITGSEPPAVVWVETTATEATDAAPGDWNGANHWETGTVPTASDDVSIITDQLQGQTPFFPVTVRVGETASAHSVTMDDFNDLAKVAPELDVGEATVPSGATNGELSIAAGLSLSADSILKVFGTLSVGTVAKILGDSVLHNYSSGLITLGQGGEFGGSSSITNAGTIEVVTDALDVQVNIANSGGTLRIDNGATLKLSSATAASTTITGGNLTLGSGSTLDVESSGGATLDGVTVTGTNASTGPTVAASLIEVGATGSSTLNLDDGTSIKNGTLNIATGSTLDIEKGATGPGATLDGVTVIGTDATSTIDVGTTAATGVTLTLTDGTTVTGGSLDIATGGEVYIQNGSGSAGATLDHVTVAGGGEIEIGTATSSGSTLILSDGTTISGVTLTLDEATDVVDIEAGINGKGVTFASTKISNAGTLSISDDATLTLSGATIDGGAISNGATRGTGHIDVSGLSAITNDILNDGDVTIASATTLTLDGDTVNGTTITETDLTSIIQVGATTGAILTLDDGASIAKGKLTIAAGSTLDIEKGAIGPGATLDGVTVVGTDATSTIDVGTTASGETVALLDDGTSIKNATLNIAAGSTLDIEKGAIGPGATLDGVTVVGTDATSTIDVGTTASGATVALLDDGTIIRNGALTIGSLGTLDVESTGGATLDGVALTNDGNIDIGTATTANDAQLTLEDNTVITDGTMTLGSLGVLDVEKGTATLTAGTPDATLDHVSVVSSAAGSAITVGASGAATLLLTDGASITNVTITVDATDSTRFSTLDLDNSTITGGTLIINGELDSTGTSFITGAAIVNASHIDVIRGTLTIDPAPATNTGTIEVKNDGTLVLSGETITNSVTTDGVTTKGLIQVDATDSGHATLDLDGSTIDGGTLIISGELDSTGDSSITGATITNTGTIDVTGGTLTIDATSTLDNTGGTLEANGGNLIIDAAIVGSLDIKGGAVLELGSSSPDAYSQATVTFEPGATGTLKLDHSQTFDGMVAGLDDGTIDLADIAYGSNPTVSFAGNAAGGILSVFVGGVDVSNIDLTGDYLGVHWVLSDDGSSGHGTDVKEVPGAVAGLDPNGNATEGVALTASITDGGQPVSDATYDWQVSHDGGKTWVDANGINGLSSYTPVEADEGQLLRVALSFVDGGGQPETSVVSAGVVRESLTNDLVATLDSQTARQGVTMHVLGVKDGGITVTTGLTYAWQDSSDNGLTWVTVGTHSSFTPGESDEGKLMQLVVTYADASGSESSTYSLGMPNDLSATLDSTTAQQGLAIHVTGVKDGGTHVSSGVSYAWQVSSDDGQHWTTVGTHSSFTPIAADDGETLQVIVTYSNSEENESVTYSLGTVAPAKEWLGGSHDWQTAGQWSTSGVPTSSDNALIDASGFYTVTIDRGAAAHSLIVNDFGASVEIVGGNTLTLGGNATIEAGLLQIDAGGTLKDIAASATIAGAFIDNGTIEAAGGKLEIASALDFGGGKFKIDAGATLQFDHPDTHNVAFAGSGELILKDPAHFSGTISDSGGGMTSADVVDVAGFDTSATVSYSGTTSGGTVTISEAGHTSVHLKVGANSTDWSAPIADGDGGILIHDPSPPNSEAVAPTNPGPAASSTVVASGPNQILTANAASDTFVFNFPDVGHTTVTDFHPATDSLQFSSHLFANLQAALNATHDDGLGDTVIALDAHDTITLHGILKAQLQASDFHFV